MITISLTIFNERTHYLFSNAFEGLYEGTFSWTDADGDRSIVGEDAQFLSESSCY